MNLQQSYHVFEGAQVASRMSMPLLAVSIFSVSSFPVSLSSEGGSSGLSEVNLIIISLILPRLSSGRYYYDNLSGFDFLT